MEEPVIDRIREATLAGDVRFSEHAVEELLNDGLHIVDAESALLTGEVVRVEDEDSRIEPGPRYTVVGLATDLATRVAVVCRFEPREQLLVITCYEKPA